MAKCDQLIDRISEGVNELWCSCGTEIIPEHDLNTGAILAAWRRHKETKQVDESFEN